MHEIIEKKKLNRENYFFKINARLIAKKARPGQFVILRIKEEGERIPLTIADYGKDFISVVFQVVGGTSSQLSKLVRGDKIRDLMGPLGKPTDIENFGTVVIIGGGLGIAPCFPIARAMKNKGNKVVSILGARTKELFFWKDRFEKFSNEVIYCTDDGSFGIKGFVTDALKNLMKKEKIDRIIAIGPPVMMKFVTRTAKDIPVIVSLNPIMVDGMGMCGGCRVNVAGRVKFACVDGPEFVGQDVDWDSFINRNESYKEEEHACRIE
ncbi:sulfide/dihydroorotate dehydrogenase-like FAD/NAD-binding protein [Candidatus Woesearchaeota archaeon]|nr:sulfide/dihydroorotate dehydrogenase-like FAD/NAD-binding protein [Candidatus Woesearchaeota archaeon]